MSLERYDHAPSILTGDPVKDARNVHILLDTIAEVNSNRDLDALLASVADRTLELTGAERAILMLVESGELVWRTGRDHKGRDLSKDVSYSRSVPVKVLQTSRPEILANTADENPMDLGQSIISLRLLTVMCAPLTYKGRTIGVVYVDSRATTREFMDTDLTLFTNLADQAGIAIENARLHQESLEKERIEHELRIAQDIQQNLLPRGPYPLPGFDLYGMSEACDETGGDYFDYFPSRDGKVQIAIGDVVGHGVGAALYMATARALLRAFEHVEPDPSTVFQQINSFLERDMEPGQFMTLFLCELDPAERTFRYVCAGHNPPVIFRADGSTEELSRTGIGLGIAEGIPFRTEGPIPLHSGDMLFMFTDGVPEARNAAKEQFEPERMLELVAECRDLSSREITEKVRAAVEVFRGEVPVDDDLTMVVLKVH